VGLCGVGVGVGGCGCGYGCVFVWCVGVYDGKHTALPTRHMGTPLCPEWQLPLSFSIEMEVMLLILG